MNGRQFINVVLKSDVVTLKDVVVVGYGVQKKVNLTGAVSSVSTDELEGKPISNVLEAMQGTTPGLVIQDVYKRQILYWVSSISYNGRV